MQDCHQAYGAMLYLIEVKLGTSKDVATDDDSDAGDGSGGGSAVASYEETVVKTYQPPGSGASWWARRMHHMDVRPVALPAAAATLVGAEDSEQFRVINRIISASSPERAPGSAAGAAADAASTPSSGQVWLGFADGDRFTDGSHHYTQREQWFVDLKHLVWPLVIYVGITWLCLTVLVVGAGLARPLLPQPDSSSTTTSGDKASAEKAALLAASNSNSGNGFDTDSDASDTERGSGSYSKQGGAGGLTKGSGGGKRPDTWRHSLRSVGRAVVGMALMLLGVVLASLVLVWFFPWIVPCNR